MRTTLDIDEKLLNEVMVITRAKTKREAVNHSLKELIRQIRIQELIEAAGKMDLDLTSEELDRRRAMDMPGEHWRRR